MLESMISGIYHFTESSYEDFQTFDIELQAHQAPIKTSFISVKEGQILTVWLRYSNEQISNRNLIITVSLINEDEKIVAKFEKEFQFGNFLNSKRKTRYHKLGEYHLKNEFRGYLSYELNGTWTPTTSALVLRKSPPILLPLKQICFFVVGLFILIIGIETIAEKNKVTDRNEAGDQQQP
jgi:hypothetical protein